MARKSPEQYEKEFYEIHGDNLTLLETYTKRSENLKSNAINVVISYINRLVK